MFRSALPLVLIMASIPAGAFEAGGTASSDKRVEMEARGSFDVGITPQPSIGGPVGLLTLTKTYRGDLEATATGQMLGLGDPAGGTAAYVEIEQVTGTLNGRNGSFALQHSGSMHAGTQQMAVTIAPGSGTGQLSGIAGRLDIIIVGRAHSYVLHYSLPD